jgi:hypothetical protein
LTVIADQGTFYTGSGAYGNILPGDGILDRGLLMDGIAGADNGWPGDPGPALDDTAVAD